MNSELFYSLMERLALDGASVTEDVQIERSTAGIYVHSLTTEAEFNMAFMLKKYPTAAEITDLLTVAADAKKPAILYTIDQLSIPRSDRYAVNFVELRKIMSRVKEPITHDAKNLMIRTASTSEVGQSIYKDAKDMLAKSFHINRNKVDAVMGEQVLTNPGVTVICSYLEGYPVGTLSAVRGFTSTLWNIGVDPKFRGQNIGTKMVDYALGLGQQQLLVANFDAIPFYEKNSFVGLENLKTWVVRG